MPVLLLGGCCGGVCTGCVQGACSRLSAVWFPPNERGTATSIAYASLFAGQTLAYVITLLLCTTSQLKVFLYFQVHDGVRNGV